MSNRPKEHITYMDELSYSTMWLLLSLQPFHICSIAIQCLLSEMTFKTLWEMGLYAMTFVQWYNCHSQRKSIFQKKPSTGFIESISPGDFIVSSHPWTAIHLETTWQYSCGNIKFETYTKSKQTTVGNLHSKKTTK